MHELGILCHAIRTVDKIAEQNGIKRIDFITLEVGKTSSFVPEYLHKLYPVAIDAFARMKDSELKLEMIDGEGLNIKEIGYQK